MLRPDSLRKKPGAPRKAWPILTVMSGGFLRRAASARVGPQLQLTLRDGRTWESSPAAATLAQARQDVPWRVAGRGRGAHP